MLRERAVADVWAVYPVRWLRHFSSTAALVVLAWVVGACSGDAPGQADTQDPSERPTQTAPGVSGSTSVSGGSPGQTGPPDRPNPFAPEALDTLNLAALPSTVPRPRAPLVLAGSCPGECCVYGDWLTSDITQVYRRANDTTGVAFTLPPRTPLTAARGYVGVDTLGAAVLEADVPMYLANGDPQTIPGGDTVILIGYQGEGFYHAWHDGRVGEFSPFDSEGEAVFLRELVADWWVEITSASGDGWLWMERTPPVWGADGCGMPGPPPARVKPCSAAWLERVEQAFPVGDAEGHGPDLGSEEWMMALARRLGLEDQLEEGLEPGSPEWCATVDRTLWGAGG